MSANKYAHTADQREENERGKLKITHEHCTRVYTNANCKQMRGTQARTTRNKREHNTVGTCLLFGCLACSGIRSTKKLRRRCFILAQARTPFICILHLGVLIAAFAMIRCIGWKVLVIWCACLVHLLIWSNSENHWHKHDHWQWREKEK